jgi:hypothetical protein
MYTSSETEGAAPLSLCSLVVAHQIGFSDRGCWSSLLPAAQAEQSKVPGALEKLVWLRRGCMTPIRGLFSQSTVLYDIARKHGM